MLLFVIFGSSVFSVVATLLWFFFFCHLRYTYYVVFLLCVLLFFVSLQFLWCLCFILLRVFCFAFCFVFVVKKKKYFSVGVTNIRTGQFDAQGLLSSYSRYRSQPSLRLMCGLDLTPQRHLLVEHGHYSRCSCWTPPQRPLHHLLIPTQSHSDWESRRKQDDWTMNQNNLQSTKGSFSWTDQQTKQKTWTAGARQLIYVQGPHSAPFDVKWTQPVK